MQPSPLETQENVSVLLGAAWNVHQTKIRPPRTSSDVEKGATSASTVGVDKGLRQDLCTEHGFLRICPTIVTVSIFVYRIEPSLQLANPFAKSIDKQFRCTLNAFRFTHLLHNPPSEVIGDRSG